MKMRCKLCGQVIPMKPLGIEALTKDELELVKTWKIIIDLHEDENVRTMLLRRYVQPYLEDLKKEIEAFELLANYVEGDKESLDKIFEQFDKQF